MNIQELKTTQLLDLILGDFNTESNTEAALDAYLFAKKVANAASVAMKLTSEFAVQKLIEQGGKGANSFASYSIVKEYERTWQPNEQREFALSQIEAQMDIVRAAKERLAEIEKAMEKAGQVEKREVGKTIKVSLLEKI